MGLTKITAEVNNISQLSDKPNIDDNLNSMQLKYKFDKAGIDIKTAVNTMISELEAVSGATQLGAGAMGTGDETSANIQAKLDSLYGTIQSLLNGGVNDGSITTTKINDGAITTDKIDDGSITTDKLGLGAITSAKINDSAVTAAKIQDGAVTNNKIASGVLTSSNIVATELYEGDTSGANVQEKLEYLYEQLLEITQGSVADGSITTAKIQDGAITSNKIASATITADKIAPNVLVPSGIICMWSGSVIPTGWNLCDGTNGTPDLRDRFIVGAGNTYEIGNSGGSNSVTLTVEQMPSHSHTYSDTYASGNDGQTGAGAVRSSNTSTKSTSNTGGGQAHENRPPYYALAFIMKA